MQKVKNIKDLLGDWNDKDVVEKFCKIGSGKYHKFLDRNRTIKSNWSRLHHYAKNILLSKKPMKILDVGCGNGATMEIFRFYGHEVCGIDYTGGFEDKGTWRYEPLIKSQNLSVKWHSGSDIPYPFADNEFDLVICWGTITFFKPISIWPNVMDEFARLSKNTILLGVNAGTSYDAGKKYLDSWSSKKFKLAFNEGYRYRWKAL